jgi:hypothetical protein
MAGWHHRGNEEKGDEVRRHPGPDTLEKRIGKVADSHISPYIFNLSGYQFAKQGTLYLLTLLRTFLYIQYLRC